MSGSDRRLVLPAGFTPDALRPAAEWLAQGGLVVYPTDTFYGLAADPGSRQAIDALFDLKGRDATAALPLIAASRAQIEAAGGVLPGRTVELADRFWPGPLSLVIEAPSWIVPAVHAGRGTVAVRVPDHPAARALAEAFGRPITATSANRSGEPPATVVSTVALPTDDPRLLIVDGGPTAGGAPSTLVDARGDDMQCLRHGAIAWERVLTSR